MNIPIPKCDPIGVNTHGQLTNRPLTPSGGLLRALAVHRSSLASLHFLRKPRKPFVFLCSSQNLRLNPLSRPTPRNGRRAVPLQKETLRVSPGAHPLDVYRIGRHEVFFCFAEAVGHEPRGSKAPGPSRFACLFVYCFVVVVVLFFCCFYYVFFVCGFLMEPW